MSVTGGVRSAFDSLVRIVSDRLEASLTGHSSKGGAAPPAIQRAALHWLGSGAYLAVLGVATALSAWTASPDARGAGIVLARSVTTLIASAATSSPTSARAWHRGVRAPTPARSHGAGWSVSLAGIALRLPRGRRSPVASV